MGVIPIVNENDTLAVAVRLSRRPMEERTTAQGYLGNQIR